MKSSPAADVVGASQIRFNLSTAEVGQRVAGHGVHRHALADGHPGRGQLLDDLEIHLVGDPGAAEFLRVGQAEQAALAE